MVGKLPKLFNPLIPVGVLFTVALSVFCYDTITSKDSEIGVDVSAGESSPTEQAKILLIIANSV